MGINFPPIPLGLAEIQIHENVAKALDLSVGDKVEYIVNGTNLFSSTSMLALMTAHMDDVHVDF